MRPFLLLATAFASLLLAPGARASGEVVPTAGHDAEVTEVHTAVASAAGRTTRWSSIRVAGDETPFVWVLPVRPGASVDLASDAWLEALDAATAPRVTPPPGCDTDAGIDDLTAPTPTVTVAPAEVQVVANLAPLQSTLDAWGTPATSALVTAAGALFADGWSLALLRFAASGVSTRTVRVVDDAPPALPLWLTTSPRGPIAITAFVLGGGPTSLGDAPPLALDPATLTWESPAGSSYRAARDALLAGAPGRWLPESSGHAPLFSSLVVPGGGLPIPDVVARYFAGAAARGETSGDPAACAATALSWAESASVVADACPAGALLPGLSDGGPPRCTETVGSGEIAPAAFGCGLDADDVALALSGHAPRDAWITRAVAVRAAGAPGEPVSASFGARGAPESSPVRTASGPACSAAIEAGAPPLPAQGGASAGSSGTPGGGSGTGTTADEAAAVGDGCAGGLAVADACNRSSGSDGSDDSSDGGGCGSSSSDGSSDSSCSKSDSGSSDSSSNCAVARPRRRGPSPVSRVAFLGAACALAARRGTRGRRPKTPPG